MKAAIYARVSTERQAERGTIGSQVEALRAHLAGAGEEPAGEYCDDGCSGARLDRPGLDALRDAAEAGLFEVVWCLSPDRLARSYAYQVLVLDELARFGVRVAFTDAPGLDQDDPQAKLLTQVQGVIAEYERAKIAERYRRGKLFRARAGEVITWKAPYGYRRIPRSPDGPAHLEIFEPEAAVARRIFAERAAGTTIRQICRQLNADAVPTPTGSRAVWGTSTLDRILRKRGLHRPHLLQPHRDRPGPPARPPLPPGAPPPRRLDRDQLPVHHRRSDVPGRRQNQHRQRQMEPAPRRTRRLAAARAGQMRALRHGHQLPQDARPQRHLAPLLLLPQPRPAARRRPGPPLPRAQHPRRRPG
jgi:DNA invertase Pin-like site-specific DNA recombinase